MAHPISVGSDVSAGTSECPNCGYQLQVQSVESLPPCPNCEAPYVWKAAAAGTVATIRTPKG